MARPQLQREVCWRASHGDYLLRHPPQGREPGTREKEDFDETRGKSCCWWSTGDGPSQATAAAQRPNRCNTITRPYTRTPGFAGHPRWSSGAGITATPATAKQNTTLSSKPGRRTQPQAYTGLLPTASCVGIEPEHVSTPTTPVYVQHTTQPAII
jgi:hypothetical protein